MVSTLNALRVLCLLCPLLVTATNTNTHDSAKVDIEVATLEPSTDDIVCTVLDDGSTDCYSRIFQPTSEFQIIREGQAIPKGLHVRMNWQTGVKEAKFVDGHEQSSSIAAAQVGAAAAELSVVQVETNDAAADVSAGATINIADSSIARGLTMEETQTLEMQLKAIVSSSNTTDKAVLLDELEESMHHIDVGISFAHSQIGIPAMLDFAEDRSNSNEIRAQAALVIANALSNNPDAKKLAARFDIVSKVWKLLETEIKTQPTSQLPSRFLFLLAVVLRSNLDAIREFTDRNGIDGLRKLAVWFGSAPEAAQQMANKLLPGTGSTGLWGFSKALDLQDPECILAERDIHTVKPEETNTAAAESNECFDVLLVGSSDVRHILKTAGRAWRHKKRNINCQEANQATHDIIYANGQFHIIETQSSLLARNMLLLSTIFDPLDDIGLHGD
eukprot:jgi/Hompol1/2371/HPOL_005972-RA